MAHDVFVSYSSEDKPVADAVCATLEAQAIRCWMAPRDVLPGEDYAEALVDAIGASALFVLVFSSNSNRSPQVRNEVERAAAKGIAIIPFRIEDVPPSKSMEYFISRTHWLDALTPPLKNHLERLAEIVNLLLTRMRPSEGQATEVAASGRPTTGEPIHHPLIEQLTISETAPANGQISPVPTTPDPPVEEGPQLDIPAEPRNAPEAAPGPPAQAQAPPAGSEGGTWTKIEPVGPVPPTLLHHSAVWNPNDGKMYVFGGMSGMNKGGVVSDLWVFAERERSWTHLEPSGTRPNARYGHCAVWDATTAQMYVFGGFAADISLFNDLWTYAPDANAWAELKPTGVPPLAAPGSAVWDDKRKRMYIACSPTNGGPSEVWGYDADTNAWSKMSVAGSVAPGFHSHVAVWDAKESRMLVFGVTASAGDDDPFFAELWEYSLESSEWSPLEPRGVPPPGRIFSAAAWDGEKDRMYLFGGTAYSQSFNDLRYYDPETNSWRNLAPDGMSPPPRNMHAMVWNPAAGSLYAFGGTAFDGSKHLDFNDLWVYTLEPAEPMSSKIGPLEGDRSCS